MIDVHVDGPVTVMVTEVADTDPRVIAMLEALIRGQGREAQRDVAELQRDLADRETFMTFADDLRTELGKLNTRTTEIKTDQADLIARLAASPSEEEKAQILADFARLNDELGTIASGYTPVPVTPGEVPGETPVPEPEPGTEPTEPPVEPPADGNTGTVEGTGDATVPAAEPNT